MKSFFLQQSQCWHHDGDFNPHQLAEIHSRVSSISTGGLSDPVGTQRLSKAPQEEKHCNESLKKPPSAGFTEESSSQRYSVDPTVFLGQITQRGGANEDGCVAPRDDKSSSGSNVLVDRFICSTSWFVSK